MSAAAPGILRRRSGDTFRYTAADGRPLDEATLARIKSLAIPPAWEEVWICPREDGHLQAAGRDARGRKQYRYHQRWRELRDETKFGRVASFARALPRIRRRVERDLAAPGLPREKVLAAVVRLLETTLIRVGNEEYARHNASFGLTTLRDRQVRVRGSRLRFRFRGKSGVEHDIELSDRALAAIVRRMQDLPGQELVQYVDEQGETRAIESDDVNAYMRQIAGAEFTSKDFRTWAGTLLAAKALQKYAADASARDMKRNIACAVEDVARALGNTKAVCRKCYIHPAVFERYLDGTLGVTLRGRSDEAGIVALLRRVEGRALTPRLTRSISSARQQRRGAGMNRRFLVNGQVGP